MPYRQYNLTKEISLSCWVVNNVDFQKRPSSCLFSTHRTKVDFVSRFKPLCGIKPRRSLPSLSYHVYLETHEVNFWQVYQSLHCIICTYDSQSEKYRSRETSSPNMRQDHIQHTYANHSSYPYSESSRTDAKKLRKGLEDYSRSALKSRSPCPFCLSTVCQGKKLANCELTNMHGERTSY